MPEFAVLSALLGAVYDASLDGAVWPLALERASGFLNCMGGMIGAYDLLQRNAGIRVWWGYEQKYLDNFDYYMEINPALRPSFRFRVGEVGTMLDVVGEEFYQHRVYTEWAKPQGIIDVVQSTIEKTPMAVAALAFSRHESKGIVDLETRRRMELIVPHFRRALLIGKVIDLAKVEAAAFADTIDGLAAAVFLVETDGRMVHANARGEAMLAAGDMFHLADGVLTALDAKAQRSLAESFAAAADGDVALEARGIATPVRSGAGDRYAAHVLPMTAGRRRDVQGARGATAALFVRKIDMEFPAAVRSIAEIYRLSVAETRTLHVILDVGRVGPTSILLHLSESTVKTHLRHIFQKTGARSQVDLVKLAAGLASPIAT
ncbi:MAG TPA: helix-turn-helix transcriptional regulator [Bauldia sp.]|nr:helix-turn-helix transcriptional regulator [Bauldia sp.]